MTTIFDKQQAAEDWAAVKAAELLPHYDAAHGIIAGAICPACKYQAGVAAALRTARAEGQQEGIETAARFVEKIATHRGRRRLTTVAPSIRALAARGEGQ